MVLPSNLTFLLLPLSLPFPLPLPPSTVYAQLAGVVFLGVGLWAWSEKVSGPTRPEYQAAQIEGQ